MTRASALFVGIDIGTSGARALAIDDDGVVAASAKTAISTQNKDWRHPQIWWRSVAQTLHELFEQVSATRVQALCVDGTSGTLVALDDAYEPMGEGSMYSDAARDTFALEWLTRIAPRESGAHGGSSALVRAIELHAHYQPRAILHQADWIASKFSDQYVSDPNNALKTGFDPMTRVWPDWIDEIGPMRDCLPDIISSGQVVGPVSAQARTAFGFEPSTKIIAGTTDGCASFLATGAQAPGEGVTALGSSLTLKLVSNRPVFAPEYGVYSHKLLDYWLVGGASNTGGKVLLNHFTEEEILDLSQHIDPETDSMLDYYPLAKKGERFPICDPQLESRIAPKPENHADYLKGFLQGIANIEATGYARLTEFGAPSLKTVFTVGGGAQNEVWARMRQRKLGVEMLVSLSTEAAYGTALLARHGAGL